MRAERLELFNFCQHRHRAVDFHPGLTAILGPNGSGKSNLLNAIGFAITGDLPTAGTLAANINQLAPTTERSFVRFTFQHANLRYTVQRNLRPERPTATLEVSNGESFTGANAVTNYLMGQLGLGADLIKTVVVVAQSELFGFLDKSPAKRAQNFQRLFRTERASTLHAIIGKHLEKLQIPAVAVDLDAMRRNLAEKLPLMEATGVTIQQMPAAEECQRQRQANEAVTHAVVRRTDLTARYNAAERDLQQTVDAMPNVQAGLQEAEQRLHQFQARLQGLREEAIQARRKLDLADAEQRRRHNKEGVDQGLARCQQELQMLQPPPQPDGYTDVVTLRKRYADASRDLAREQHLLSSFHAGVAACPTCGTTTDTLQPRLAAARELLPRLQAEMAEATRLGQLCDNYDSARRAYDLRRVTLETSIGQFQAESDRLSQGAIDLPDMEQLRQVLAFEASEASAMRSCELQVRQYRDEWCRLDGKRERGERSLLEMRMELNDLPVYTDEQVSQSRQNVAAWDKLFQDRAALTERYHSLGRECTYLQSGIANAEQVLERAAVLSAWAKRAGNLRDLVHPAAAPRLVSQRNLQSLQGSINDMLRVFGSDFMVRATEGLTFDASFPNGIVQEAERLSVGQMVALAFCFRLALNMTFAENIGGLFLDEPTAYLDAEHIQSFEPVLQRLRDFSSSRGLQVVIVTHERSLAHLFDHVIQL